MVALVSLKDVIRRRTVVVAHARRDSITIVDGFQVEGAPVTQDINAHTQPATPKEMRNAPPGQLQSETLVFWTEFALLVADRLTVGAVEYIVQSVDDWNAIDGWVKAMGVEITDVIP